jgi:hypothetical protein
LFKISKFVVGPPDSSGDMSAEVEASISNTSGQVVRWIQHRMILESAGGFPLATSEGAEECRLEPDESIVISSSSTLSVESAGTRRDTFIVRSSATLYSREFFQLGEIEVPTAELRFATIEKSIESLGLCSDVRVQAVRSRCDDAGNGRVECRALLKSKYSSLLEQVGLSYELLDADGATVESGDESVALPAGGITSIELSTSWLRPSQLKISKLRLALTVFLPRAVEECRARSLASDEDDAQATGGLEDTEDIEIDEENGSAYEDEQVGIDADDCDFDANDSAAEHAHAEGPEDDDASLDGLETGVRAVLQSADAIDAAGAFRSNRITDDILDTLSDGDLVQIGVTALGLRRRILTQISVLRRTRAAATDPRVSSGSHEDAPPAHPARITDWSKVLGRLATTFVGFDRVIVGPSHNHPKFVGALEYTSAVHRSLSPLLIYDDTFFGSGKDGLLVSELGVHWRNLYQQPGFVPWASLHCTQASGKSVVLEPGGSISCAYAGAKCAKALAAFINHAAGAAMVSLASADHPQRADLLDAIRMMHDISEDGFVIAEDPVTGRFVQFCNGDAGPVFDVPFVQSPSFENERAAGFLEQCGFGPPVPNSESLSFQREYDRNRIDEMVTDALKALQGIYRLQPGVPLKIIKGWQ